MFTVGSFSNVCTGSKNREAHAQQGEHGWDDEDHWSLQHISKRGASETESLNGPLWVVWPHAAELYLNGPDSSTANVALGKGMKWIDNEHHYLHVVICYIYATYVCCCFLLLHKIYILLGLEGTKIDLWILEVVWVNPYKRSCTVFMGTLINLHANMETVAEEMVINQNEV